MRKLLPIVAAVALLFPALPAISGEKVEDELAKLRTEVAALRAAIEKLSGRTPDTAELTARIQDIARRLQAGEKLADGGPELTLLREFLVSGSRLGGAELGARAMGLIQVLPEGQKAAFFTAVLADVGVPYSSRQTALRELSGCGEQFLRPALLKAMEVERLMPMANTGMAWGDIRGELALAGFRLKEKSSVDFALDYLTMLVKGFETSLRLKQEGVVEQYYGPSIYGNNAQLLRRLALWSGNAELQKLVPQAGRYAGSAGLKKTEEATVCLAELQKVREWWKANQANFDFPPEPAQAPDPARRPDPIGAQPDPGRDPRRPEVF